MWQNKKQFGAVLSVGLNCFLIVLKLVIALVFGSVGVLASAIDSLVDLVASVLAYFAIKLAEEPPDSDHPFGHGKFEDFAGLVEAALIMVGAIFILGEAFPKLLHPVQHEISTLPSLIVMGIALILDFVVSQLLFKIAKETESPALYADAHHLSTDVWSALAVIAGLILVKFTGNPIFDPLMAILIAVMILGVGAKIVRQVFKHLMDSALPAEEEAHIMSTIFATMPKNEPIEVQALKTRRSGSHRLIVFNLLVNPQLSVAQAHHYCDEIEAALEERFPNSLVNIHLEPLEHQVIQ